MSLFEHSERAFAEAMSNLAYCNPFLPERVEWERKALGSQYVEAPRGFGRQVEWVTDAGLKGLAGLTQLQTLFLHGTKVTDVGLKELKEALPLCHVFR